MITFIGFLFFLAGITAFVLSKLEKSSKLPEWLHGIKKGTVYSLIGLGIFLMFIKSMFFFADRGFNYLLVSPTGKMSAVMEQGIKFVIPGTKIDKWQK